MKQFIKKLKQVTLATSKQRKKEMWDVEGILNNQKFKFDTRPIRKNAKIGNFATKADKMVFNLKDEYVIIDIPELIKYIQKNKIREFHLQTLIAKLDWNIILSK